MSCTVWNRRDALTFLVKYSKRRARISLANAGVVSAVHASRQADAVRSAVSTPACCAQAEMNEMMNRCGASGACLLFGGLCEHARL
jgi:hypothetical protein